MPNRIPLSPTTALWWAIAIAAVVVPTFLQGCASTHYYVDLPEARRAIHELQSADEVVVLALEEDDDKYVKIRLEDSDKVLPAVSEEVEQTWEDHDDRHPIPELHSRIDLLQGFTYRQRNPGPTLLKFGIALASAGTALALPMALIPGEPSFMIPCAGPMLWATTHLLDSLQGTASASFVMLSLGGIMAAMVTAVIQGAGLTCLIASAVSWKRSREVTVASAPVRPMRFSVAMVPIEGGMGMGVGGRF